MISIGTANEKGTIVITCAFTDEDGAAVVPTTIVWSLVDRNETVINSREQVSVAVPAASVDIVLSGDDLAMQTGETTRYAERYFVVEVVYDSSAGSSLPLRDQGYFKIENLKYVA